MEVMWKGCGLGVTPFVIIADRGNRVEIYNLLWGVELCAKETPDYKFFHTPEGAYDFHLGKVKCQLRETSS